MDDITRMVSKAGFIQVFWERIRGDRRSGGSMTFKECYHRMEDEFERAYGCTRFRSFDAFRMAEKRSKRT
jgi:hypothetical protein